VKRSRKFAEAASDVSVHDGESDVLDLMRALKDPVEARRWEAVYALGSNRKDGRAVAALVGVLLDKCESPRVRGQAAECLGMIGRRKALRALVDCSGDDSADVRFWCVFAMGQCQRRSWRRRHKPRAEIVKALEARLVDHARPDVRGYWRVGLEALAVLSCIAVRHPAKEQFRKVMLSVLENPLQYRDEWRWAAWYWNMFNNPRSECDAMALFDAAVQKIHAAGFDPVEFGREDPND
jgi:hypothetical protein